MTHPTQARPRCGAAAPSVAEATSVADEELPRRVVKLCGRQKSGLYPPPASRARAASYKCDAPLLSTKWASSGAMAARCSTSCCTSPRGPPPRLRRRSARPRPRRSSVRRTGRCRLLPDERRAGRPSQPSTARYGGTPRAARLRGRRGARRPPRPAQRPRQRRKDACAPTPMVSPSAVLRVAWNHIGGTNSSSPGSCSMEHKVAASSATEAVTASRPAARTPDGRATTASRP